MGAVKHLQQIKYIRMGNFDLTGMCRVTIYLGLAKYLSLKVLDI